MGVPSKTGKIIIVSIIALVIILVIAAVFCLSGGDNKVKGQKHQSKIPIRYSNVKSTNSIGAMTEIGQNEIILVKPSNSRIPKKKTIEKKKNI
ncbi:hypothetical protein NEPAR08_2363 [Nematocida parisii]|nr:hypothetical protein NEPAR08_2363 [Nematocida parisii]KAI5131233.1 hypothetical protein NEPAR03_2345 [Nematocida parisii]